MSKVLLKPGQDIYDENGELFETCEGDFIRIKELNTNIRGLNNILNNYLLSQVFTDIKDYLWLSGNPLFTKTIQQSMDNIINEIENMERELEPLYFPQGYK
jgi:hypothetical protein